MLSNDLPIIICFLLLVYFVLWQMGLSALICPLVDAARRTERNIQTTVVNSLIDIIKN